MWEDASFFHLTEGHLKGSLCKFFFSRDLAPWSNHLYETFDLSGYNYAQTNDQNKSICLEDQLSDSPVPCGMVFLTTPHNLRSSLFIATHFSSRLTFVFLPFQTAFASNEKKNYFEWKCKMTQLL